ncbi:MAG: DHH family phosphoesterase [Acutalibacteraceae bacterium]
MKQQINFTKILCIIISVVLVVSFSIVAAIYETPMFYIEILIMIAVIALAFGCVLFARNYINNYFLSTAKHISGADDSAMNEFGIAIMIANSSNEVVWYNEKFRSNVLKGIDVFGNDASFIFDLQAKDELSQDNYTRIEYKERYFNVFSLRCSDKYEGQTIYFFYDDTAFSSLKNKYENSKPCVFFINIDGLDLLLRNTPESTKNEILGKIERCIEELDKDSQGYIQKVSTEKYFLIVEKSTFDVILANKFEVLSKVRSLDFGERGSATLSIGVGIGGENLAQCVEFANNALDMALGRGGDQAVIKNDENFEFFGGVTESRPINTAVRMRLISQTLKKLILSSENILVMGHSFSDMDAYGAAYGLFCAIKRLGKDVNIVCNYKNTLAGALLRYTARVQPNDDFILAPDEALGKIRHKTLLIVVDTHRCSSVESEEVYKKCEDVVVIDHHRRNVDFIDNSILFYHDPSSSSTCEMVTELLRYFGADAIDKSQANALLAGIMLDTKNFVLRTSARTFEASAYLREKGADPVVAKDFFAENIETYSLKSALVSSAKTIKNYAIAYCTDKNSYARVASAQAADELLTIKGIDASFVATEQEKGKVNISARSLGKVNVQTIMEQLGGGGHQTMAAAQVECMNFSDCCSLIAEAIQKAKENE